MIPGTRSPAISEIPLHPNGEERGVLVVIGPGLNRLRRARREGGRAREALLQVHPAEFGREREVLHKINETIGAPTAFGDRGIILFCAWILAWRWAAAGRPMRG